VKIRILTFHAVPNHGAVLQAFALQEFLRAQGHEVSFIDYRPPYLTHGGGFWWPRSAWHLKANVVIAYQKAMAVKNLAPNVRGQWKMFEGFIRDHLRLEGPRVVSMQTLRQKPPAGDLYICGSDQIWNPSKQFGVDPACYLDFGPPQVRRVSYAPSFGRPSVPTRHEPEIARLLHRLDALSVREESGKSLIASLAGRDAVVVPDPTFLWEWPQLSQETLASTGRGIFCYVLRSGEGIPAMQRHLQSRLGGSPIQPFNPHQRWPVVGESIRMDPLAWVHQLAHSRFVLTNSFHGTVFAILARRPFATVSLGAGKEGLNERVRHLLEELGLKDRRVMAGDCAELDRILDRPIDWDGVTPKLLRMRQVGETFLKQAIAGIP